VTCTATVMVEADFFSYDIAFSIATLVTALLKKCTKLSKLYMIDY